jgi:hypothetical protein
MTNPLLALVKPSTPMIAQLAHTLFAEADASTNSATGKS